MIFLETDRLRLRNLILSDVDIMFDYRNNEICSIYQRDQTKDYKGIKNLIDNHKEDEINIKNPFIVAIELKSTNEMIGEIVVIPNEETISIGYTVSYKHHRKGYAFESVNTLITLLHEKFPNWEFISFTDPKNIASMNLLLKLGYKNLGYISSMGSQAFGKWIKPKTEEEFSRLI